MHIYSHITYSHTFNTYYIARLLIALKTPDHRAPIAFFHHQFPSPQSNPSLHKKNKSAYR